ncbi:amidase [Ferrovibrio xuzhouensis]|uniref:Amidase n=1 Tax=Ferrovibrio xuzhouensis TaxID=1576914 RepID=A0ABV7VEV9_9PROT
MSAPLGMLQALRAFRAGTLDRKAYVQACATRAEALEGWLHAFTYRPAAAALPVADSGPLAGIPVAVKDIFATADMPTTNGSPVYADHLPDADAAVVARIRNLGGTVLGKTVTTEFAWRHPGPTVNPWNPAHTPGGSSSGSAAAVAAGIAPLALGSQTIGSVIRPAAYCGVVGYKPSFGAVPRDGVHPLAGSLDHVGFFTRHVEDAAYALSLLAGSHGGTVDTLLPRIPVDIDGGIAPLAAPRLGIVRPPYWSRVDAEQNAAFEAALATLRKAGARVEPLELPGTYWHGTQGAETLLAAEAAVIFGDLVARFPDRTSTPLKDLVAAGTGISAPDYIAACRLQARLRHDIAGHMAGFDAIVTAPATGPAPEGLGYTGDAVCCSLWTFLGVPAITLPVAQAANGLPLGLQLLAGYRQDAHLLRTAAWAEAQLTAPALMLSA